MKRSYKTDNYAKRSRGQPARNPDFDAAALAIQRYKSGRLSRFYQPRTIAARQAASYKQSSKLELKGVDTQLTLSPIIATTSTNASSFTLNLVPPGSGSWNRVGRRICMKNLRIKGNLLQTYALIATTNNILGNYVRMVVVWDRQPSSGSVPTYDTIFGNTDQAGTESTGILSTLKYDNMQRFRVLRDTVINCPADTTPGLAGTQNLVTNCYPFDEYIKLPNLESTYSGQTATQTIADISTGALYVFFRANSNAASNFVEVDSDTWARLRYYD